MRVIKVPNHHFVRDGKGGWIKRPGRIMMRLSVKQIDRGEIVATSITTRSIRLQAPKLRMVEERLSAFAQAYWELDEYLSTPLGDVPVQADSARIRNMWHLYLVRGRELIDALGTVVQACFGLPEPRTGLNTTKLASLRRSAEQHLGKLEGMDVLLDSLNAYEDFLSKFIELRNRDKERNDTLLSPPYISENGVATGGVLLFKDGASVEFVDFLSSSYHTMLRFCCNWLGTELPSEALEPIGPKRAGG